MEALTVDIKKSSGVTCRTTNVATAIWRAPVLFTYICYSTALSIWPRPMVWVLAQDYTISFCRICNCSMEHRYSTRSKTRHLRSPPLQSNENVRISQQGWHYVGMLGVAALPNVRVMRNVWLASHASPAENALSGRKTTSMMQWSTRIAV